MSTKKTIAGKSRKTTKNKLKTHFIIRWKRVDHHYVKHPTLKGHYIPLTPEQEAQYIPDKAPLWLEMNKTDLDEAQQQERHAVKLCVSDIRQSQEMAL